MTDKQVALEVIGRLPENASPEKIAEELQVLAAIRQGQADVAAGRVHSHEEVEKTFLSWTQRRMAKTAITH